MALGEEIFPLGGNNDWFRIHFTENPGMAFGLKLGGATGKILLSSFRIVAVSFMGYYLFYLLKRSAHLGLVISLSFILSGAVGNILDSAFYGFIFDKGTTLNQNDFWMGYHGVAQYLSDTEQVHGYAGFLQGCVVDMLYFPMFEGFFPDWMPFWGGKPFAFFRPVFNLADSAITFGVLLIIFFQGRFFKHEEEMAKLQAEKEKEDNQDAETEEVVETTTETETPIIDDSDKQITTS